MPSGALPSPRSRPSYTASVRWLLLALCLARLWIMPLPSSFWTDETGTAFVVERPADPSLLAPARLLYSSIYYAAPRRVGGVDPVQLRYHTDTSQTWVRRLRSGEIAAQEAEFRAKLGRKARKKEDDVTLFLIAANERLSDAAL